MPRVVAKKSERMSPEGALLADLREMIIGARAQVARAADSTLVMLYWHMGRRIRVDILKRKRAAYGEEIVATLSQQLTAEFGRGYSRYNLSRMVQFAEAFPERRIVVTLSQQLGWSHFVQILPMEDPLKQEFYTEMCRVERWSVRTLRQSSIPCSSSARRSPANRQD
jgi:hypothetical protein